MVPVRQLGERSLGWLRYLAEALTSAVDDNYEPRWDRARGEFTWGFQLEVRTTTARRRHLIHPT